MLRDMHKLIDQMILVLFASDKRRLAEWVDRLVIMNQEAGKHQFHSFIYNGLFFRSSHVTGPIPKRASLHISLAPQMDQLLRDKKIIDDEKSFVRQAIVQLLDPCTDLQDIRDALPDCLVSCIPALSASFERTRPPAFTIKDNPRALRQYEKMLPNIQVYSATRLI